MKKQITLTVLMFLGLTFGTIESKAQTTSTPSKTPQTTELSAPTNNLMASAVESKVTVTEKSSVNAKQKPNKTSKKDWEDRSLAGKILIVTAGAIFVVLCIMYGTVTVG